MQTIAKNVTLTEPALHDVDIVLAEYVDGTNALLAIKPGHDDEELSVRGRPAPGCVLMSRPVAESMEDARIGSIVRFVPAGAEVRVI